MYICVSDGVEEDGDEREREKGEERSFKLHVLLKF